MTERRIEDVLDAVVSVGVRVLPDFVLAARDGDLTRLVVRGAAAARLVDPDGTARLVDAGGARTWADLEINGEPAVLELMAGHGVSLGATLPLSSGVGMASAVRVVFAAAPAAPEPEPEPEPVEPEPEASNYDRLFGETVHPAAGPILFTAEDEDADDVRGGGQACTLSGGPPTGAPAELEPSPFSLATPVVGSWPPGNVNGTAAGSAQPIIDVYPWDPSPQRMAPPVRATPAPAEQSARHRAGGLCETAGEPAQAVTPVPSTGADDEAAMVTIDRSQLAKLDQSGWAGPAVLAARCPDGHFSPANAGQCRVCRARIPPQEPVRITRPPLGVLRLTAGDVVPLDRGVVLGRAPEVADRPAADRPHAVRLAHAGGDISRAHVEVVLDGWHVLVTDLNSTNGTTCPTSAFQVVEGGRPVSIPLPSVCHVWVPTTMNLADVHFSAQWTTPLAGVTESVRGQDLALQAAGSARPGTGTIAVGVAGSAQRQPLTVQVIQPPLATVRPITVSGIKADESRTIDIRPYVTSQILNAAPTAISTAHTGGMNASVTANGGSLTVRPAHDARDQITFSLTITDVAGRTDRVVTGQLTLHVLGLPATIGRPAADANRTGGHQVQVSWPAPAYDGGAPIDQYRVRWAGGSHSCPASPCVVPGLRNGQPYTFTLAAHNIAGFWSAAESPASNPATPDAKPGPVTGLRISRVGDQTLGLTWAANHPDGTPVDRYQIEIADVGTNNPGTRVVQVGGGQTGYTATRLTNNDPYRFRVQAHNAVGWGPYGGAIPAQSAGKPAPMPVPSVPAEQSTSPQDQTVANVSWQPETDPNGPDVKAYSVYRKVGAGGYTVLANCRGLSRSTLNCVDTVQNDGTQYYYAVTAINGADIESTPTNGTLFLATGKPDQIQAVTVQASDNPGPGPQTDTGPGYNGAIHVTFAVPQPHGARITSVKYSLNGAPAGQWASPGSPGQQVTQTIGGLVNGQSYAVSLSACNEGNDGTNENCGQSSPDSNQVVPYGPPPTPSAGASNSGTVVTYSWGGGTNGRPVHFWVSLDGGPYQDRGTSGGSQQIDRGYSHNYSISVYVRDSAGQQSPTAGASGSTPPPPPVVTISWGGQAPPSGCQGDPTCTYITLAASGFSPGTHVVRWYDDFESGAWWTENINIGANGSGSLGRSPSRWFAYGFQHHSVWAVIDAVRSVNTLDSYGNPKVGQ